MMNKQMKMITMIAALFAITVLLTSCTTPQNKREYVDYEKSSYYAYSDDRNTILYEYSFEPNRSNDVVTNYFRGRNDYHYVEIPEADAKTFKVLDQDFGQDANHLFFRTRVADFVDYETFKYLDYAYYVFIDKNNVYQLKWDKLEEYIDENGETMPQKFDYLEIVEDADVNSYHLLFPLAGKKSTNWAKDDNHIFWQNQVVEDVDVETFRCLTSDFVVDKDFVYSSGLGVKVPNKNQSSEGFKIIREGNVDIVYTDNYLYHILLDELTEYPIEDVNSISDFDSAWFFKLDDNVYYCGRKIEGADADSFEVIEKFNHMARDKEHLFYENEIVARGIDPQEVTFNREEYEFFYRDKKWNYETKRFEKVK